MPVTRRRLLGLVPPALGALLLAACGGDDDGQSEGLAPTGGAQPTEAPQATAETGTTGGSAPAQLAPTPACGDDDDATLAQTEGPYFTPNSPQRRSLLEEGLSGEMLRLDGFVVNTRCQPVENALLDFWHCDADGEYDNVGYRLRGHQFSDASGAYSLVTILPGIYPGRTRHIHVKVQAPGQPVLTTQLYFPDEPENANDGIFDPALLMDMPQNLEARFRFVLDV